MGRKKRGVARNVYGAPANGTAKRGAGAGSSHMRSQKKGRRISSTAQQSYQQTYSGATRPASYSAGAQQASQGNNYSRYSSDYQVKSHKKKRSKGKKIALVCLLVFVCLLCSGGVAAAMYVNGLNNNMKIQDTKEEAEIADALAPAVSNEPFYMLLIGCDDRDGVDGVRADTTILARIDPGSNEVTLISIPRDTAITIDGYGTQKFNAAYTYGGTSGTIDAASKLCGVKISHYAEVHFDNLIDLINYMGGITVDVPLDIDDEDAGGSLSAGLQTLDGEQAMIFARSRSYVTGDFQRTTNQRLLIEAAVNKMVSLPATELPGLITKMSQSVTTDYNVTDLISLANAFQDKGNLTMYSAMIPSTTAEQNGVSYVVADTTKLKEMMAVVDSGGDPSTVTTDNTVESSSESSSTGSSGSSSYYGSTYTETPSASSFARESAG